MSEPDFIDGLADGIRADPSFGDLTPQALAQNIVAMGGGELTLEQRVRLIRRLGLPLAAQCLHLVALQEAIEQLRPASEGIPRPQDPQRPARASFVSGVSVGMGPGPVPPTPPNPRRAAEAFREQWLNAADDNTIRRQDAMAKYFTEEALNASILRDHQKRALWKLFHDAAICALYQSPEHPVWRGAWKAFCGAGKSIFLKILCLVKLEMLSNHFVEYQRARGRTVGRKVAPLLPTLCSIARPHNRLSTSDPTSSHRTATLHPLRQTLILCSGKTLASLREMKQYLQLVRDDGSSRWEDENETKIRDVSKFLGIDLDQIEDFLKSVHVYESGDLDRALDSNLQHFHGMLQNEGQPDIRNSLTSDQRKSARRGMSLLKSSVILANVSGSIARDAHKLLSFHIGLVLIDEFDVAVISGKEKATCPKILDHLDGKTIQVLTGVGGRVKEELAV